MTIGGFIGFIFVIIIVAIIAITIFIETDNISTKILCILVSLMIIVGAFFGIMWFFQNTAAGQRAIVDQKSNLSNGLERTVTVYTANGEIIAQYSGRIDIEGNDGGYVLFDYDGKRYTYYNCFVESIAEIK